jgi:predicted nucleic acid-binding protein
MIDTNIFDLVVANDGVAAKLREVIQNGKVKILSTHIQEDELAEITNLEKRKKIALVPREVIPTHGFVVDVSRIGMARIGSEATNKSVERIEQGNPRHTHDALIAATADQDTDVLVTEDTTLTSRVKNQGLNVEVWNYQRFSQFIMLL